MPFAIIETGGKQYRVTPGQKIKVEKLSTEEKNKVVFDKVLFVQNDSAIKIGQPYIKDAKVEGEVLKNARDKKKIVFRYHSKTRYRKKNTHRQDYTEVQILKI